MVHDPYALLSSLDAPSAQSVLAIVASSSHIFAGSQSGFLDVYDISDCRFVRSLSGHTGAVLALEVAPERSWLYSSSADSTVRVWHSGSLECIYVIHALNDNIGDIYSLAWSAPLSRLYFGCQDTSVLSIYLPSSKDSFHSGSSTPFAIHIDKPHRFFDSSPRASRNNTPSSVTPVGPNASENNMLSSQHLYVADDDVHLHAHHGYIYSMIATIDSKGRHILITGSGDDTIKIWACGKTKRIANSKSGDSLNTSSETGINALSDDSDESEDDGDEVSPLKRGGKLTRIATLPGHPDTAVLTLAIKNQMLFSGHQDGIMKIWDLETLSCLTTITAGSADILSLSLTAEGQLFSMHANGDAMSWSKNFTPLHTWKAHDGICLASTVQKVTTALSPLRPADLTEQTQLLITGGNDMCVRIWKIGTTTPQDKQNQDAGDIDLSSLEQVLPQPTEFQNSFIVRNLETLRRLISFKSVSLQAQLNPALPALTASTQSYKNDAAIEEELKAECRETAIYLRDTLAEMGANSRLISDSDNINPIVVATFTANSVQKTTPRKRVLYYGHYDVVKPGSDTQWETNPYELTGKNGWFFARGISDNKGPILAVADAAATLLKQRELDVDVVMVIEGEEESGSTGFEETLKKNEDQLGPIDVILVCNAYWIGEEIPCMVWGMRGVIHATVQVNSSHPDAHSGMHGGAILHEPLVDLSKIIAGLYEGGKDANVAIPGFYDSVREMSDEEKKTYDEIITRCKGDEMKRVFEISTDVADPIDSLTRRWRTPCLSVHKIQVSGPSHSTVIPSHAKAAVSIRIVPDQDHEQISKSLEDYIQTMFESFGSTNTVSVRIARSADHWVGNPSSSFSRTMAESIKTEWGVDPLWIREGGSIPPISFLAKHFKVDAVHLPFGQASDSAHLPNERIRLINLEHGRNVIMRWMAKIAHLEDQQ